MAKVISGLVVAVLVVIAAARVTYGVSTAPGHLPVNEAWAQSKMEFVAWNNQKWTAWIRAGEFTQVPQNSDSWSRHSNGSLAYTNWDGEPWQAKIDGDMFLLAYQGNWHGSIDRSVAIQFRDWSGNNRLRTVADLQR